MKKKEPPIKYMCKVKFETIMKPCQMSRGGLQGHREGEEQYCFPDFASGPMLPVGPT